VSVLRNICLLIVGLTCAALALLFGLVAEAARVAEEWCLGMAAVAAWRMR
jgi:hypothetical protein